MDGFGCHPSGNSHLVLAKLFGTTPRRPSFNRKQSQELSRQLGTQIETLEKELHASEGSALKVISNREEDKTTNAGLSAKTAVHGNEFSANIGANRAVKEFHEIEEEYKRSKIDFLHRNILSYQQIFRQLASLSGGDAFLFLDDLYHIRRSDQANVVDYFHRIGKDNDLWLKVGTIRHRTRWYVHGDPPLGMKLGDDADEIDLDLTLEKYSLAKDFLERILKSFADEAGIKDLSTVLTDGALERLVLASGGVARDFLSIFRRSITNARERGGGHRGERVGAEDVNVAAGEYDSSKREEFKRDTLDDDVPLEDEFQKLRDFCLEKHNSNCFLLDKDSHGKEVDLIHELVDLKLIHLVRSRVTVSGRTGKIFEAYMLDLSQYAGSRKKRELELIEFWKPSSQDSLRKVSLIYSPALGSQPSGKVRRWPVYLEP